MSVKPFRSDDLSPSYILAATLEFVDKIDCVAVIQIFKDGSHGVSLSSIAGKDLCYMKCALDDTVAKVFEGARPEQVMTIRPMREQELARDHEARELGCEVHGVLHCHACENHPGAA